MDETKQEHTHAHKHSSYQRGHRKVTPLLYSYYHYLPNMLYLRSDCAIMYSAVTAMPRTQYELSILSQGNCLYCTVLYCVCVCVADIMFWTVPHCYWNNTCCLVWCLCLLGISHQRRIQSVGVQPHHNWSGAGECLCFLGWGVWMMC